jgi:hypothetical protein
VWTQQARQDYYKPVSKVMSENNDRRGFLAGLVRGLMLGLLAALPLGGLVLFFEITRPAELRAEGPVATRLATNESQAAAIARSRNRYTVARLKGVSAELTAAPVPLSDGHVFSASDAARVFAASSAGLINVGFQSEFVAKDGRRLAVLIVSRDPIGDQVIPETGKLVAVTPASTAKLVSFVWGPWLYRAEIEDKGPEPEVVVQKLL